MNKKVYKYDQNTQISAVELSIFTLSVETKPGIIEEVHPKSWNTKSDFIQGTEYNEGDIIASSIDLSQLLYAHWPAKLVNLVYNSFNKEATTEIVEVGKDYIIANDTSYGFACWNDFIDKKTYFPGDTIRIKGSKNLFASCYYEVSLKYDLNGGALGPGKSANDQFAMCSKYVDEKFEDKSHPARILLTANVPTRIDGSHFSSWKIGSLTLLENLIVELTSNSIAIAQYLFDPVYLFDEEININGAATIVIDGPHDEGNRLRKSYNLTVNDGYIFDRWEVTIFDGSGQSVETIYTKNIDVYILKIGPSSILKTLYARSKAFLSLDASWTKIYDVNGNLTKYKISGIAKDDDLHVKGKTDVKKVEFADIITGLQKELFKRCTGLTDVRLTKNIQSYGESIFEDCVNLTSIIFN